MRGINRRGLRLELVRGLGIALATLAVAVVAASAQGVATTTTLTAGAQSGCTQALTVAVTDANGQPVTGAVTIDDAFNGGDVQVASAALNAEGQASITAYLVEGSHDLTAVYAGNSTDQSSTSAPVVPVTIKSACQYTVSVAPTTVTMTAGQSSAVVVSVTPSPEYIDTLTAPVFVTISCSGLPDQASCTFTPEKVEILSTTTGALTSSMVIGTQAASSTASKRAPRPGSSPIAWAFLLPGALGFAGLASRGRRRRGPLGQVSVRGVVSRWLSRVSLLLLVSLVTLLGTTACNPRYSYLNHGPIPNPATPAGTYTVTIAAQSSNGVTAITQTTTMAVTVK